MVKFCLTFSSFQIESSSISGSIHSEIRKYIEGEENIIFNQRKYSIRNKEIHRGEENIIFNHWKYSIRDMGRLCEPASLHLTLPPPAHPSFSRSLFIFQLILPPPAHPSLSSPPFPPPALPSSSSTSFVLQITLLPPARPTSSS